MRVCSPDRSWRLWRGALYLILGVLTAAGALLSKPVGRQRGLALAVALMLFHYAWLSYLRAVYPHSYTVPTDEIHYFQIADSLLRWDFSQPFRYTLGYPAVCAPLVALLSAHDPYLLSRLISGFSAYVMMPVCIVLAFCLLRRLCESDTSAFGAILLWQLIPKLYLAAEQPFQGMCFSPLGALHTTHIFLAYQYSLCGFNSQSEWASVAVLFACGLLALTWRPRRGVAKYVLHGLLFGFACLIRLNSIFWAPLLAYLLWVSDTARLSGLGHLVRMLLVSVAAFGLAFGCQMVVNGLQFGSPLVFPYLLHSEDIHAGFALGNLRNGTRYYADICAVPLCLTLPALLLMRHRQRRTALILWTLPMLLFFCGFCVLGQHYRFLLPLFYGMTAAVVCVEFWRTRSWAHRGLLVLLLAVLVFPCLPFGYGWSVEAVRHDWGGLHWAIRLRRLLFPPLLGACLWAFRHTWRVLCFLVLCVVLVLAHAPPLCLALVVGLLGYAAVGFAGEVLQAYGVQRTESARSQ